MTPARARLKTFDVDTIPTLDIVVEAALELFLEVSPAEFTVPFERPLVMGSGNALVAAKLITHNSGAVYANESDYAAKLTQPHRYDGVVVLSASGGKHAIAMVEAVLSKDLPVTLVTNTKDSPAAALLTTKRVFIYPKNREPYTYNTSTYLGPILGSTKEDPEVILHHLKTVVSAKLLRNFADYSAITFILPPQSALVCEMVNTKFDELFGPTLIGRAFSSEEIKHAKTVVTSGDELFISLGVENDYYGLAKNRLQIPLPKAADVAAIMAMSYFIVGKIQAAHLPYFANNISTYCQTASDIFGHEIKPIVE